MTVTEQKQPTVREAIVTALQQRKADVGTLAKARPQVRVHFDKPCGGQRTLTADEQRMLTDNVEAIAFQVGRRRGCEIVVTLATYRDRSGRTRIAPRFATMLFLRKRWRSLTDWKRHPLDDTPIPRRV